MTDEQRVSDVAALSDRWDAEERGPWPAAAVVGRNLARIREELHLSQGDLARMVGTCGVEWTQVTVARVERGRRDVTAGELVALGLVLGLRVGDLLDPGGSRVLLGRGPAWVPGRVVGRWADGDRHYDDTLGMLRARYAAEGMAHIDTGTAKVARYGGDVDPDGTLAVTAALHRWVAAEADAGRTVDQLRWQGKRAQLMQAWREGKLK